MEQYVAFLRGINIGRHHKVPMAELKSEFGKMGFKNISTILNSGNVLFEANGIVSEDEISIQLESVFGFSIPTLIREFENLVKIYNGHPFEDADVTKDIRLYVSFLKNEVNTQFTLPWKSEDGSFQILKEVDKSVLSLLNLTKSSTPKAMEALEKLYGKDITTRNWNTIERIFKKAL